MPHAGFERLNKYALEHNEKPLLILAMQRQALYASLILILPANVRWY